MQTSEKSTATLELVPNDPQKETTPKDCLKVGVHTVSLGGNGDIAVGAKLVDGLCSSSAATHFNITLYTDTINIPRIWIFSDQLHNSPIIAYETRKLDESTGNWKQPPITKGGYLHIQEDTMVFVHTFADRDLMGENTVAIEIGEYSAGVRFTNLKDRTIGIGTGFKFDPKCEAIQAGLVFSRQYERLLRRLEKDKEGLITESECELSAKVSYPIKLRNKLGFYYVSTLGTNSAYFGLLQEATPFIPDPMTIITPVGGNYDDNRDAVPFAEGVRKMGFNYIAQGIVLDQGSQITIVNPYRITNKLFQTLTLLSELPLIVTGDQSLTEAIQRASSDTPCPFLVYTLGVKQAELSRFMAKIDPYIAKILDTYYYYELSAKKHSELDETVKARLNLNPKGILPREELVRLFYDPTAIMRFNETAARIPQQLLKDRVGYVDNPQDLVDATKTLEKVLEAIRMGHLNNIRQFMPKVK